MILKMFLFCLHTGVYSFAWRRIPSGKYVFLTLWMLEAMEQLSVAKSDASLITVSLDIFLFSKTCHIFSFDSLDSEIVQWYIKVWNLFVHFVGNSKMCFHLKSLSAIGNLFHNIFPYSLPSDFLCSFRKYYG